MLRAFINFNKQISSKIDSIYIKSLHRVQLDHFVSTIRGNDIVADVGGGKKPVFARATDRPVCKAYHGLDYDFSELQLAPPGVYDEVFEVDITQPPENLFGRYDKIICRNTLEHVDNGAAAIAGISNLLKPGGECYIKIPCRYALFAFLNRKIPEKLKRALLFYLFPNKKTDGFPAFYHGCTISEIAVNSEKAGMSVKGRPNKVFESSYFTFFVPLFLLWRVFSLFQYILIEDYCESFEIVLEKVGSLNNRTDLVA